MRSIVVAMAPLTVSLLMVFRTTNCDDVRSEGAEVVVGEFAGSMERGETETGMTLQHPPRQEEMLRRVVQVEGTVQKGEENHVAGRLEDVEVLGVDEVRVEEATPGRAEQVMVAGRRKGRALQNDDGGECSLCRFLFSA